MSRIDEVEKLFQTFRPNAGTEVYQTAAEAVARFDLDVVEEATAKVIGERESCLNIAAVLSATCSAIVAERIERSRVKAADTGAQARAMEEHTLRRSKIACAMVGRCPVGPGDSKWIIDWSTSYNEIPRDGRVWLAGGDGSRGSVVEQVEAHLREFIGTDWRDVPMPEFRRRFEAAS